MVLKQTVESSILLGIGEIEIMICQTAQFLMQLSDVSSYKLAQAITAGPMIGGAELPRVGLPPKQKAGLRQC